jgi:hypothetical protein
MREGQSLLILAIVLWLLALGSWCLDDHWPKFVIQVESTWWKDALGDKAYDLGRLGDRALHELIDPIEGPGGFVLPKGLRLGLRQALTRLLAVQVHGALWILLAIGFAIEAKTRRAARLEWFVYNSPRDHSRARSIPKFMLGVAAILIVAPLPLHPIILPALWIITLDQIAQGHILSMKQ